MCFACKNLPTSQEHCIPPWGSSSQAFHTSLFFRRFSGTLGGGVREKMFFRTFGCIFDSETCLHDYCRYHFGTFFLMDFRAKLRKPITKCSISWKKRFVKRLRVLADRGLGSTSCGGKSIQLRAGFRLNNFLGTKKEYSRFGTRSGGELVQECERRVRESFLGTSNTVLQYSILYRFLTGKTQKFIFLKVYSVFVQDPGKLFLLSSL